MLKQTLLTLALFSIMLISCKKSSTTDTDNTTYFKKFTEYTTSGQIQRDCIDFTFIGNDKYELTELVFAIMNNKTVVSGTKKVQYDRVSLGTFNVNQKCYNSIIP